MSIHCARFRLAAMAGWLLLSPALAGPLLAQDTTIRGTVVLPDGTPAQGATVTLRGTTRVSVTDEAGGFTFIGVKPGRYEIEATLEGFASASAVATATADRPAGVAIRLRAVAGEGERVDVFGILPPSETGLVRLPGSLTATPYSIAVIPAERIEQQKAQSLNEIVRYTPGVQSEQWGGLDNAFDFLTIRGFGGSSFSSQFRDGVRLTTFNFSGFRVEPYGAEAVEVLRGATSVMYGRANPGGIINFNSKRPTATPFREVIFELGNFGHVQGKFDFSGPVAGSSSWRYRAISVLRDADTQVDFQPNDRVYFAPALTWQSANTSLTFLGEVQRDSIHHFQFLPRIGVLEPSASGFIPESRADGEPDYDRYKRHQGSAGYLLEQKLPGGWGLRQQTRFDRVSVEYDDVYGSGLDPTDPQQRLLNRFVFGVRGESNLLTADGQVQKTFADGRFRHTVIAGLEHQYSRFDDLESFGVAPALDVYEPVYGSAVEAPQPFYDAFVDDHQTGLYFSDRSELPGGLVLSFGGRQNFVSNDTDDRLAGSTTEEDTSKFVWQGGLAWAHRSGFTPYFSYSQSFQPLNGVNLDGARYVPETGQQYEGGLRYQHEPAAPIVGATVFDLRRQNVLTPDPNNELNQIQTGEIRSRGLELEAEKRAASWDFIASYTFQDVEITESHAGDVGFRPSVTPEHMWSAWGHHEARQGRLRGLGAGLGIRFQGATTDSANTLDVPGFTLVDALLAYTLSNRLRFALNVQNLLDKEYVAGCSGDSCYYGRSRQIYGSTTYDW